MGTILDRIQIISSMEGITIGALERKIGASKGVLSRAINNGTDIQSKWIQILVENYPQYSTDWLLTGKEPIKRVESNCDTRNIATPNEIYQKTETHDSHAPLVQALINERRRYDENTAELLNQNRDLINQNRELTEIIRRQTELLGRPSTARTDIAGCADAG